MRQTHKRSKTIPQIDTLMFLWRTHITGSRAKSLKPHLGVTVVHEILDFVPIGQYIAGG